MNRNLVPGPGNYKSYSDFGIDESGVRSRPFTANQ